MRQMPYTGCSKCNINNTDTTARKGKTTDFKNKNLYLPHNKHFLWAHFFTAPIFHYYANKRLT